MEDPGLITGTGPDPTSAVALGATSEIFLIVANVATAVLVYPILRRRYEIGAIAYVAARLVEAMFIAMGVVSLLAFLLMRQDATAPDSALRPDLVAIYIGRSSSGQGSSPALRTGSSSDT